MDEEPRAILGLSPAGVGEDARNRRPTAEYLNASAGLVLETPARADDGPRPPALADPVLDLAELADGDCDVGERRAIGQPAVDLVMPRLRCALASVVVDVFANDPGGEV